MDKKKEILEQHKIMEEIKSGKNKSPPPTPTNTPIKKESDKNSNTPSKIISTSKNVLNEYMKQASETFWEYVPVATNYIKDSFKKKHVKKLEKKESDFVFLEKRGYSKLSKVWKVVSSTDHKQSYVVKRSKEENNKQYIKSIFREAMIIGKKNFSKY